MTRVAPYARVSTRDKDQNPETQLHALRRYVAARDLEITAEYIDEASATNMRDRKAWRALMEHVRKGGIDLVLVTKLDRAFRSSKDTYDNLAYLDQHKVGFIATTQPIDTSTSTGKLLLGVLAAVAEFERALIVERTLEGLSRAKAQGKIGHQEAKTRLSGVAAVILSVGRGKKTESIFHSQLRSWVCGKMASK